MHKPVKHYSGGSGDSWILTLLIVLVFVFLCIATLFVYSGRFSLTGMTFSGEQSQRSESGDIGESIDAIEIGNLYGDIRISRDTELDWEWNLTTWADTQEKADEFRDRIQMEVSENDGRQAWHLVLPDDMSECNGVKSDLVLRVPESVSVVVSNRHGDNWISDISGGIAVKSEHGGIQCADCPCPIDIKSRHGDVVLQNFHGVTLKSGHGDLDIDGSSGTVSIDSAHIDISAQDVDGTLQIKNAHGDIDASGIRGDVSIDNSHGDIEVDCESESVNFKNRHADTTVRIHNLAIRNVVIRGQHNDIDLSLPDSLSPELSLSVKHGDVRSDFDTTENSDMSVDVSTIHGDIRIRKHSVTEAENSSAAEAEVSDSR